MPTAQPDTPSSIDFALAGAAFAWSSITLTPPSSSTATADTPCSPEIEVPDNITLPHLPSYVPVLNPAENIWQYLRSNKLAIRVHQTYEAIVDACCNAWNDLHLLSAYKRVGLPEDLHTARSKRLRFLVLNTVGRVVRHARETLLRCAKTLARALCDRPRTQLSRLRPALPGG